MGALIRVTSEWALQTVQPQEMEADPQLIILARNQAKQSVTSLKNPRLRMESSRTKPLKVPVCRIRKMLQMDPEERSLFPTILIALIPHPNSVWILWKSLQPLKTWNSKNKLLTKRMERKSCSMHPDSK